MYIWKEEIDLNVHDRYIDVKYVTTDMSMYKGAWIAWHPGYRNNGTEGKARKGK